MWICFLTLILKLFLTPRDGHHDRIFFFFFSKKLYVNRKTEQLM